MLSQVKLIAEPWDLGAGGYQVGNFRCCGPSGTASTATRCARFWKGDGGGVAELATRIAGSSDLYEQQRPPAVRQHQLHHRHDGFTLHDLVSYNEKHNEANGEDNSDGESHNLSWNCGVEGPTDESGHRGAARASRSAT